MVDSYSSRVVRTRASLVLAILCSLIASHAWASWPAPGAPGLAVCTPPVVPIAIATAPDDAGGVYMVWTDYRSASAIPQLYGQHVDGAGTVRWSANGLQLSSTALATPNSHGPDAPSISPDGAGGAIIVWRDFRADTAGNVYAQRVNANGVKLWPSDVPVGAGPLHERYATVAADGAGGAFVTWSDDRTGLTDFRIQRLTSAGALAWGPDGVSLSASTLNSLPRFTHVCSDAAGGAFVTYDIGLTYVQRFSPSGAPLWTPGGVIASLGTPTTTCGEIAPDGQGGALLALLDYRSQNTWAQAFAQRLAPDGSRPWAPGGIGLSGTSLPIGHVGVVPDGQGSGYFDWQSYRNDGSGLSELRVQRLGSTGSPLWSPTSELVAADNATGFFSGTLARSMTSDGNGGVVLDWVVAAAGGEGNALATRLAPDGSRVWPGGTQLVATMPRAATMLAIVPDRTGGAITSWQDPTGDPTLGAARITGNLTLDGPTPRLVHTGVLCSPSPAHAGTGVTIRFAVAHAATARVRVFDTGGRLVRSLALAAAGEQALTWDTLDDRGARVRPGLYLVRVDAPGFAAHGRVLVLE